MRSLCRYQARSNTPLQDTRKLFTLITLYFADVCTWQSTFFGRNRKCKWNEVFWKESFIKDEIELRAKELKLRIAEKNLNLFEFAWIYESEN